MKEYCSNLSYKSIFFFLSVALGSIPELPADSCWEIKVTEGEKAVSGEYWFNSIIPSKSILAYCDMDTLGKWRTLSDNEKVRVMGYPKIAIIVLNGGYQRGRGIGLGVVYSFSVI